jgi:chemotaxis family two-component system response regulator PixH
MVTILVVEDSPSERELISDYLEKGGYTVISAEDAKIALEKTKTQKPDLVITDIVMPGMNGFELCRSLKKNPETKDLPVVICSSKNQELDKLWGKKQGVDVYLTKPFTREDILQAVQKIVG